MPTTIISNAVTVPVSAGSTINSNFIVTGTGSISVGSAVALGSNAANGFTATVHGTVESYWQSTSFVAAIYSSTPGSRITVGPAGDVYGEREAAATGSGVIWTAGTDSLVINHGNVISGTIEAVRLAHGSGSLTNTGLISGYSSALVATGTLTQVNNSGTMSATGAGGATIRLGGGGEIVNSGAILATGGVEAVSSSGAAVLTNSGTISSTAIAISFDDAGGSRVTNTGTIETSDIFAFLGGIDSDIVINRGTIQGNVQLGNGTNTFDNQGGTFSGTVEGGTGSDLYLFDAPTFGILDTGGYDSILTTQSYSLIANAEIEALTLLGSAVSGEGNALDNLLTGNSVGNILSGLAGADTLRGLGGDDALRGQAGNDTLYGDDSDDLVRGGVGADWVYGGEGDDTLTGDAANDRVFGDDGEDVLIGGAGRDTLYGGNDADTFQFRTVADSGAGSSLRDIIIGFEGGLDLIDLTRIDANSLLTGNQAFAFIGTVVFGNVAGQLRLITGANAVVQGDVNGDGVADFELQFNAVATVSVNDLLL